LHSKASNARRIAQARGEIHDISVDSRGAPQQFVPQCIFFATFPTLSAHCTRDRPPLKNLRHSLDMFFLLK
jgi:hypothetical protein